MMTIMMIVMIMIITMTMIDYDDNYDDFDDSDNDYDNCQPQGDAIRVHEVIMLIKMALTMMMKIVVMMIDDPHWQGSKSRS